MLSEATEMYLITIYRLTVDADYAAVADIADMRGLHHSSVSEKLRRLAEQGYVIHEAHQGARLTQEGRKIALNVLRKHRLIKTFMVQLAGYSIDEVYDEACRLEHAITDRFADSLEKILDFPEVDPHGSPIPSRDGSVKSVEYNSLNDFTPGDTIVVRRIDALNQEKLSYLRNLGLIPGARVEVLDVAPFDGPITLRVNNAEKVIAVAPSLAQEIEVSPQSD